MTETGLTIVESTKRIGDCSGDVEGIVEGFRVDQSV